MSKPFSHKSFEPHITLLTFIQGIMYINRTFIISIYTYLSDNQCTFDGSGLNSDGISRKMNTRQAEEGFFFHLFFLAIKWRNSTTQKNSHVNLKIIRQSDSNFKINFDNYSLFGIWNSLLALASIESQTFTTVIFFCKLIYAIITRQKVTKKNIVPTPLLKMKFYLPRPKLNCWKRWLYNSSYSLVQLAFLSLLNGFFQNSKYYPDFG